MTKKELIKKYSIKSVGGGTYGQGFFDCLQWFDKKLESSIDSNQYYKFLESIKKSQEKH